MVKGVKARKKGRRNWPKIIGIVLFVTIMGTLIAVSAMNQPPPVSKPKPAARDYFRFSDVLAHAEREDPEDPNSAIIVSGVQFNITAVGGNATNVQVRALEGSVELEDMQRIDKIINGTSVTVDPIEYPGKVFSEKVEGKGWPLLFEITCNECDDKTKEGKEVTIYVTNVIGPS